MILGVDPGYAKCGWSIVEPGSGRVRALGVIVTTKAPGLEPSTDKARRVVRVCSKLEDLARQHGCTEVAAEQALGFGSPNAIAANMLPWGAIVMLCSVLGLGLVEVSAKKWQRALLGIGPKDKVKYSAVEKALKQYVGKQLTDALLEIEPADRTHAFDGTGVGMLAGLMPQLATRIIERRIT